MMKSILAPVTVHGLMEHVPSLKLMLTADRTKLRRAIYVRVERACLIAPIVVVAATASGIRGMMGVIILSVVV